MKDRFTQKNKEVIERFKMESASEVGVTLKQGYNGVLTAREADSIGGQMIKMMIPEQQFKFDRNSVRNAGHKLEITYNLHFS